MAGNNGGFIVHGDGELVMSKRIDTNKQVTDEDIRRTANATLDLRRAIAAATYEDGTNAVYALHALAIAAGVDKVIAHEHLHEVMGALVLLQDQVVLELRTQKSMLSRMDINAITGVEDPLYPKGNDR
ncbi:hypothetical protein Xoosp13_135 [Xanthomonas phage Xoo-sp13]|nr:hypothetical protein Xoosp13_135 [Xanthomonas phage Xoo-sp13]